MSKKLTLYVRFMRKRWWLGWALAGAFLLTGLFFPAGKIIKRTETATKSKFALRNVGGKVTYRPPAVAAAGAAAPGRVSAPEVTIEGGETTLEGSSVALARTESVSPAFRGHRVQIGVGMGGRMRGGAYLGWRGEVDFRLRQVFGVSIYYGLRLDTTSLTDFAPQGGALVVKLGF